MTIPSAKRKFIYEHLLLHWWSFLTKKARSAKPFMNIYGFIDDHFWLKKTAERKTEDHLYHFWQRKPVQVKNSWVILNPGQKGFRGSRSQCPTINALGYRLCKSPSSKFRAPFCSKVRVSWGDLPSAASPPTYATPIDRVFKIHDFFCTVFDLDKEAFY